MPRRAKPLRIPIAPKDLLGPLLELGVEAGRPPVAGAVRLQVHVVQDPPDGARADGVHDAVGDGLAGQVLAGPVGDVQPLGDRLQASQFDDLGALEGGKSPADAPGGVRPAGACPAALLVAATDAPDGGPITLEPGGHGVDGFPGGDGQHDAGMLDLEPGQVPAASHGLEDREISGSDGQGARFSATHGRTSDAGAGSNLQHTSRPEFVALLRARPTSLPLYRPRLKERLRV